MKMMCIGNAGTSTLHKLDFSEPDCTYTLHQVDIGLLLGITCLSTEPDGVDLIPTIMTVEKYKLWVTWSTQHKANVIQAIQQGLYLLLNKGSGNDFLFLIHYLLLLLAKQHIVSMVGSPMKKIKYPFFSILILSNDRYIFLKCQFLFFKELKN